MRTARLRRKLTKWEWYARRNEKLGQGRLYNAHVYYIAYEVLENQRKGKTSGLVAVALPGVTG